MGRSYTKWLQPQGIITHSFYVPYSALLHDPNFFAKNLSKVKERATYKLSDQNCYARPEDSNARYHYRESEVRCLSHPAKTHSKLLLITSILVDSIWKNKIFCPSFVKEYFNIHENNDMTIRDVGQGRWSNWN